MQKNDKDINPFLFELTYTQIKNSSPYFYLNALFIILQFALFLFKLYFLINPNILEYLSLPYSTVFIALVVILALFAILTIFSYHFELLNSVWIYFLTFLQAMEIVFAEITIKCFTPDGWCEGDPKYILSAALVLIAFAFVIYIRTYCYCPFNDSSNPFSIHSGKTILFLFIYSLILCLATNNRIIANQITSKQFTFILTCAVYAITVVPSYANPFLSRLFSICGIGLLWTSALIWFTPIFQNLLNLPANNQGSFWYSWGFSIPIVVCLGFFQTRHLNKGCQWQQLFLAKNNNDLRSLYLQATQLIKFMDIVRKSELKGNSTQFKILWELIKFHNNDCSDPQCPLQIIQSLNLQRGDELVQQKRFNKTVQKALEFGLLKLVRQKDIYPNFIELNIEIANYELQVFHLRTKGLQLYNRQFHKETLSKQEMWGIFYLKRKIEGFQATGQVRAKGQTEEDITSFKHDIQVSVSMLAQFWYFLSDPKCNLKKLYDLANVLFPTKIRVDQTWKIIRQFKNIQCYYLYAKYLIKMFNDKQKGIKILEEAHKIEIQNNQKEQILAGNENNVNEQHGVIFLEFDGKNSGIMYQVNTACQIIFGYNKGELQGRKVNDIMPKVISIHHDRILQNYQQTNRPKMMNKERVIWGKSKDGYLFPFTICIKPVRNYYSQTSEVYASVKRQLWVRETTFFFTDVDFNLSDISASILGLFPDLHGRLHLKKKVHIDEIIPDFEKVRQKVIQFKQSHDLIVNRTFSIGDDQQYTERIPFTLVGEQVSINISGVIGYYFKLLKNAGSSNSYSPNNNSSNFKESNADASNSYWMKRENDFRFIVSVEDESSEPEKVNPMVYHGGLVKDNNQTLTLINSRIQNSFEKTKSEMNQEHQTAVKMVYGGDIKIKRLVGQAIRQIHQLSESSQQNNMVGNNDQDEEQNQQMVKPSQLTSILSRQNGNSNINLLKIFTIAILLLSTILSIFQYIQAYSNNNSIISLINTISSQNSLSSQIMYLNLYSNLYKFGLMNDSNVASLKQQINELDSMLSSIPFGINTQITYSDGANQSMILSFAIAKLISQAQLLTSSSSISSNDPDLFFVHYNSVNGLSQGCQQAFSASKSQLLSTNSSVLSIYWMYFAISVSAFAFILVLKNIVLRAVLKKKAEILNVFFQIPRYACSSIQKQCQKFIQRLTMDEDQQQFQINNEEQEEQSTKKIGRQKKRTVMGQEKTGSNFILVSLILLLFLLIYPVLVIIAAKTSYDQQQYSFVSVTQIITFQKQMAKLMSFINTHYAQENFPLNMANATQVITTQYLQLNKLIANIEERLYYLGNILSDKYKAQYNDLFFKSLCRQANSCSTTYGQDKGLNTILFYYFDYAVQKYEAYSNKKSSPINLTVVQKQQALRLLLKQFWREFQIVLSNGASQFIRTNDAILFAFMLVVCIMNMTVLMWGWIRFYNSLGQKIIATEYILTFIPIDQINKNPKIAKYIKEQVLRAR